MINKYPIGLWARTSFFKVLKSVWNKEVQDFVISRMIASGKNIKPVIVIDDTTEKARCYFINEKMDGFNEEIGLEARIFCRRAERTAKFQIEKVKIQKSNNTPDVKEKFGKLNEEKNYFRKSLSTKDEKALNNFMKELK